MTLKSFLTQTFWFPSWDAKRDIPSLEGKVALVTGSSAGLGLETTRELARKGCHVFAMGRDKVKTMKVIEQIKLETGNQNVEFIMADFLDLKSVEVAADQFLSRKLPLHILGTSGASNKS